MSRKLKGFSLAELLISLLIISIVLSAAIPTITKKSGAARENIWHWTDQNNSIYAATGLNQSAIIGVDRVPSIKSSDIIIDDAETSASLDTGGHFGHLLTTEFASKFTNFSNEGNKLAIVKRHGFEGQSDFMTSHIAFFNAPNDNNISNGFIYAGRLSMDPGNIALGIGTLMNQDPANGKKVVGENTAIGHLALFQNTSGKRNTALGRNSLSINKFGSYNTALGFGSLFELGLTNNGTEPAEGTTSENTGVGALALKFHRIGSGNTAVGSRALRGLAGGGYNTAVGVNSCGYRANGDYNICIGANAGNVQASTFKDIFDHEIDNNYNLFIGSDIGDPEDKNFPIITGYLRKNNNIDKFLSVNARRFELRPFDASVPLFTFNMSVGSDGYGTGANQERLSSADFNLRVDPSGNSALRLEFLAPHANNLARIMAYNPNIDAATNPGAYLRDISFNNSLTFDAPDSVNYWNNSTSIPTAVGSGIAIRAESYNTGTGNLQYRFPLFLNDMVEIYNSNDAGSCGPSCTKPNPYIKLHQTKNDKPLLIQANSSSFAFDKTNQSYIISLQTKDNPANTDKEQFHLSSQYGLFFNTAHPIQIASSDNNSKLELGHIKLINGTNNYIAIEGNNANILIKETTFNKNDYHSTLTAIKTELDKKQDAGVASDARLKDIKGDSTAGLKEINALEVKNYTYKKDKDKTPHVGVIAQQLQKIFPDAVTKDEDGYLRIRTEDIFYAMVNSIKDLFKQVQDLTAKVTGLDKRISELEKQNKALTEQNKAFEKRLAKLEKESAKK